MTTYTTHNVFGIQTGVAILFLVKSTHKQLKPDPCKISYIALDDNWRKEEKWQWFSENNIEKMAFDNITPDKKGNWIGESDTSWDTFVGVCDKESKLGRKDSGSIFQLYTQGLKTNRNDWVYDFNQEILSVKVKRFETVYNNEIERWNQSDKNEKTNDFVNREIKWTAELETHMIRNNKLSFDISKITLVQYRPFVKLHSYVDRIITHRLYNNVHIYGLRNKHRNKSIFFSGIGSTKPFQALATNRLTNYDFIEKPQGIPLYRYTEQGQVIDNITDWALQSFHNKYGCSLSKEDVFHYVYAVLHKPYIP
ncbi:MAG: type ISP restriction/modification enzyme [Chitinophagaceae bacterium]